jgi:hypothetical protein
LLLVNLCGYFGPAAIPPLLLAVLVGGFTSRGAAHALEPNRTIAR